MDAAAEGQDEQDDYEADVRSKRCCTKGSLLERSMYRMERQFSRHGWALQIFLLVLFGAVVLTLCGMCYALVWEYDDRIDDRAEEDVSPWLEGVWQAWTFMADGGTHASRTKAQQRVVGASISIMGIIYLGIVLAVIVDMVRSRIDAMKRGRTMVFETGHTLVVNWTDKTIPVIQELCNANKSEGGGVVVVLSLESREQMELHLSLCLPAPMRYGTQIICRNGSPLAIGDLFKVSAHNAKAVVILALGGGADEADSGTLRCVLSLKSLGLPLRGHIVAELRDIDNEPLLKLVGGKIVESLVSHDVLGRLMIMAVRQPGLAKVYEAVLGFEGHEFYMKEWPELVGVCFGDLQFRFPDAIPLGVCRSDGMLMLNPDPGRELEEGDKLIVVAEDDDTYWPQEGIEVEVGLPPPMNLRDAKKEKALVCGWRRDIRDVFLLLDSVMKEGSEVHMMSHCVPVLERESQLLEEGLDVKSLQNIRLVHHGGNTSVRKRLEVLPIERFTSCMIFADQAYEQDTMHADSHSLATLLLIRDIESSRVRKRDSADHPTPIICEVLDSRTQRTISGHKNLSLSSDFVQSNKLVAQIMAMVAESRSVKVILDELLGIDGSSLLVVPPSWYCVRGEEVSFFILAKRATMHGAILIGYQVRGSTEKTVLNPPNKDQPQNWDDMDLAVIAGNIQTFTKEPYSRTTIVPMEKGPTFRNPCAAPLMPLQEDLVAFDVVGTDVVDTLISEGGVAAEGHALDNWNFAGALQSEASTNGSAILRIPRAPVQIVEPEAEVPTETRMSPPLQGAMANFRRLCASMPEAERKRFGEALSMLGLAAADGTIFSDTARRALVTATAGLHNSRSGINARC